MSEFFRAHGEKRCVQYPQTVSFQGLPDSYSASVVCRREPSQGIVARMMTVKRKYVNRPLHSSLTTDELFCDTPATYYCECLARFGPSNCSHSRHPGIARAISRTGVISVPNLLVKTFGFLVPLVLSTCCYRVLARFVLKAMALCGNPPPAFCCVCWSAM